MALDLGCGPAAPYDKPAGTYVIGVDPSLPSLVANGDMDMKLHTTATELPLQSSAVDLVVGSYVRHHMVGRTVAESWSSIRMTFTEIARVAKPGAEVLILEIYARRGM